MAMRHDLEQTYMDLDHEHQKVFDYVEDEADGRGVGLPDVAHDLYGANEEAYASAQRALNTLMVKGLVSAASMQSVDPDERQEWGPYFSYREEQDWSHDLVPFYRPNL